MRLIIADDHGLVREGRVALLGREPDVQIVADIERADDLKVTLELSHVTSCYST